MTTSPVPPPPYEPVVACVYESLRHHVEHVPRARKAAEDIVFVLRKMGHLPPSDSAPSAQDGA